jgi:hypothetical protein
MPSPSEILSGLTRIANDMLGVAILWHVLIGLVIAALVLRWEVSHRLVAWTLALLPASVSALAFAYGNPFNGATFGLLAVLLLIHAVRRRGTPAGAGTSWPLWLGALSLAFGWMYPHFLVGRPLAVYLVAAPVGLVPCPTLAVMVGLALVSGALRGRTWSMTLSCVALFYGVFGVLRLGVTLDVGLLVGAVALFVNTPRNPASASGRSSVTMRTDAAPR